ncbi:IQ domain-containing protein E isoform X2 [Festucalex cinctus]
MSGGASDVPTDEDCEVLPGNGLLYSGDYSKKTPKKKAGKPPPSLARSPYLSSMNVNPRKASVSAWKLPWTPPCDTPGGETNSARFTSLSNHHDQRSEWDVTSDFPRHTLPTRRHHHHHHHHHHSTPNVARDKEEMHHEMTLLKKSLHEQKSDNQKLKVKLRRLEEDNAKREKQLDELLDPNNSSEYVRSLVDKKPEGSVVMNGLKQRILKLEQQCREKENAIGNLQSELRATNMLEMRMTVKNYYEEIQRLKLLLEASEKSGIFESKVFRKQQKALSSTVLRLSEDVKQLQLDNAALRDELDTESPAAGVKGYKEWSKYRLLRRLLELEERLEERNAPKARNRLEQACQTTPLCFLVHREAQTSPRQLSDVAVQAAAAAAPADTADAATETAAEDDVSDLRTRVERLEAERTQMSRALASKEEEARQTTTRRQEAEEETRRRHADQVGELRAEKEELEKRLERWRAEQTSERELQRRRQRDEVQQLMSERKDEAERWRRQLERERQRHESRAAEAAEDSSGESEGQRKRCPAERPGRSARGRGRRRRRRQERRRGGGTATSESGCGDPPKQAEAQNGGCQFQQPAGRPSPGRGLLGQPPGCVQGPPGSHATPCSQFAKGRVVIAVGIRHNGRSRSKEVGRGSALARLQDASIADAP